MYFSHIYPASLDADVCEIPIMEFGVRAGFPSPAQDYMQSRLDLNSYIIKNKEATFFMRVEGESLEGFLVFAGDILVVDRSVIPKDGNMIIATVNGELVLRRFQKIGNRAFLTLGENHEPEEMTSPENGIEVWGTVTFVVHDVV